MSSNFQSVEDLIGDSGGNESDQDSVFSKLKSKTGEIKQKELEEQVSANAKAQGLPYISFKGFPLSPEAIVLIPEEKAKTLKAVCFYYDGENLRVGALSKNEAVMQEIKELGERYHCHGDLYLISEESLNYAFKAYDSIPKISKLEKGVHISEEELARYSSQFSNLSDLQNSIQSASVTDAVIMFLSSAIQVDASDIHIEAEEQAVKIRFRVDGVLHDAALLEKTSWPKIISRLKLLSGVKINIADKPQDGRISIFMKDDRLDIRVSFLPTAYGESVVMRLLKSSSVGLTFDQLGIRARDYERLKREVERPNGMIITTGPTGSGKTTTLYAILKKLNTSDSKIITIEDPIEYQLKGINQSQTSESYSFGQALKSIVRQDPDVIMVGEIRDLETAETAIQAALTGHLVLSTIHTNDAAGTVPRFLSMGVKPFLLAPAINAMIGQRLVRKVCQKCKEEYLPTEEEVARVKEIVEKMPEDEKKNIDLNNLKFYKGKGCPACQGIGYKGRIGIYEIMTMNAEVEKIILSGNVSEYEMRDNAMKSGMVSMIQDGVIKAAQGITTLEEVFRVAE